MPTARQAPLVSIVLFVYNQERFIEEAAKAALQQTYEPLEVIISDDASTDQTFAIAREIVDAYQGPHRVTLRRNDKNMGINAHLNLAVKEAHGEFIVIAAGDDVSLPERTEQLVRAWQAGASGVFSNVTVVDAAGNSTGLLVRRGYQHKKDWQTMVLAGTYSAWGCAFACEKNVFDVFGDMPENILGEDAVIPFRCALMNGVAYIDEPLVRYRDHGNNASFWAQEKRLGKNGAVEIASRILKYKDLLYGNWQPDLDIAREKRLISEQECQWGKRVLTENSLLVRKTDSLLRRNFPGMIFLLPVFAAYFAVRMYRLAPSHYAPRAVAWTMLNSVLRCRTPWIHRKIRQASGRNT